MKKKIVAVSQEGSIRNLLKSDLKDAGYDVLLVDSEEEAIAQIKRRRPDLVLIDTVLSDIDGEAIVNYLGEAAAPPPIIVWWAHHSGSDFWSDGAYLIKTRNFFKIKSMITELCPSDENRLEGQEKIALALKGSGLLPT